MVLQDEQATATAATAQASQPSTPDLWSKWTATSGGYTLDLSTGGFGETNPVDLEVIFKGATVPTVCSCLFEVNGSDASGNYTLYNCYYQSGLDIPYCQNLNGSGNYSDQNSTLNICPNGGTCLSYDNPIKG